MSLSDCKIVDLPKIADPRGNLTFIEENEHIPFDIKRVYYLYDVPGGYERGGHAHKGLHQLIIAMSGSFDVLLDDGQKKKRFHLLYNPTFFIKTLFLVTHNNTPVFFFLKKKTARLAA